MNPRDITNQELIKKYGAKLIKDIAFWEDSMPNYPAWVKYQLVKKDNQKIDNETIELVYKNYQRNMEK